MYTEDKLARQIIEDLARNASLIREKVGEGNLPESVKLTGERVALIEALRKLKDAKVSLANSDEKDEMALLVKDIQNDISEAASGINSRLSELMKELASLKGARRIVAYAAMRNPAYRNSVINERDKLQGGHNAY
jgi:hypothetical protein